MRTVENPADPLVATRAASNTVVERLALAGLVIAVAVLAIASQRRGHSWGDDFALYLDQARSLWNGDVYEVIEDNRFNVVNSARPTFSPYGYPWVWPILLSPFVAVLGLDLDRLALVEVALLCVVVILLHRLVRRRASALVALSLSAVVGLSPSILAHTDRLLTEIPHLAAVLLALVWLDRMTLPTGRTAGWASATTRDLVVLGLLAALAFNVRREGMVLVPAILAAQLVARVPWRRLVIPHITFTAAVVLAQLLLPTAFLPRYPGDGFDNAGTMLDEWLPASIAQHLSLGADGVGFARWLLLVALVAGLTRLVLHARADIALVVVPVLTVVLFARFPFGYDPRYYIQVLPFVLYAIAQFPSTIGELLDVEPRRRTATRSIGALALAVLVVIQVWHLPAQLREARAFDRSGQVQFGPADPAVQSVLDAVDRLTPTDAVVAFMKARTMTLYTDRRSVQSSDLTVILHRADYFAMLKGSDFSQPLISDIDADTYGLSREWEDDRWVLWRIER